MTKLFRASAALVSALLTVGCVIQDKEPNTSDQAAAPPAAEQATQPQVGQQATPAPPQPLAPPDMRLELNLAERKLYVYRNNQPVATHPVAVGSKKWPTPTGDWTIGQVVWNPRWIPPKDESWAEDEKEKEPGDPENPLGRAQLVYRAPNSIHGTNEPESLGKAVSHGSIRVSNEVATELARQVMEAGGARRDESWYQAAQANRKQRHDVDIPNPIPIRVVAGGGSESDSTSSAGSGN